MKRKIRLSALLAVSVLMLALLIGRLYGYFDDTETSIGNVFTAGTLNLVSVINGVGYSTLTEMGDGVNDNITFGMVAPGDSGTITWTLTNVGNVDGDLTFQNVTVTEAENGINEPELESGDTTPAVGELGSAVDVTLERSVDGGAFALVHSGTLSGLASAIPPSDLLSAGAGHSIVYRLNWSIAGPTVGNEIQSDSATLNIAFVLTQS
jgi:hypothetical protein